MKTTIWRQEQGIVSGKLWEALPLPDRPQKAPFWVCVVGAGGKTTLIRRLAWEGRALGLRILVATTTRMQLPRTFVSCPEDGQRLLLEQGFAVAGTVDARGKLSWMGADLCARLAPFADVVLIEADGSRRLPVKVPGDKEPVIPKKTRLILAVEGLEGLGKPLEECCFRIEYARSLLGAVSETLGEQELACLMKRGYLDMLRSRFPEARTVGIFHQADDEMRVEAGVRMFVQMGEAFGFLTGSCGQDNPMQAQRDSWQEIF